MRAGADLSLDPRGGRLGVSAEIRARCRLQIDSGKSDAHTERVARVVTGVPPTLMEGRKRPASYLLSVTRDDNSAISDRNSSTWAHNSMANRNRSEEAHSRRAHRRRLVRPHGRGPAENGTDLRALPDYRS